MTTDDLLRTARNAPVTRSEIPCGAQEGYPIPVFLGGRLCLHIPFFAWGSGEEHVFTLTLDARTGTLADYRNMDYCEAPAAGRPAGEDNTPSAAGETYESDRIKLLAMYDMLLQCLRVGLAPESAYFADFSALFLHMTPKRSLPYYERVSPRFLEDICRGTFTGL